MKIEIYVIYQFKSASLIISKAQYTDYSVFKFKQKKCYRIYEI